MNREQDPLGQAITRKQAQLGFVLRAPTIRLEMFSAHPEARQFECSAILREVSAVEVKVEGPILKPLNLNAEASRRG